MKQAETIFWLVMFVLSTVCAIGNLGGVLMADWGTVNLVVGLVNLVTAAYSWDMYLT